MKLSLLVAVLPLLAVACASTSDDAPSSASDVVVNPSGDDLPGSILVALPASLSDAYFDHGGHVLVDGQQASVNQAVGNLPIGVHSVTVNGCTEKVNVTTNATTTITLGAISYVMPKDPTFGLDAAPQSPGYSAAISAPFHLETCDGSQSLPTSQSPLWGSLPGTFSATWGYNDGTPSFTVADGQPATVDLGAPAGRRLARLHAPAERDTPSIASAASNLSYLAAWTFWDAAQPASYAPTLTPATGASLVIGTRTPGRALSIGLPFAAAKHELSLTQDGFAEQNIARIDVTDVAVKQSDGTTHTTPGVWTLSAADFNAAFSFARAVGGQASTNQGIDVWPGTYTITTSYATTEAGTKTTSQTVDAE